MGNIWVEWVCELKGHVADDYLEDAAFHCRRCGFWVPIKPVGHIRFLLVTRLYRVMHRFR